MVTLLSATTRTVSKSKTARADVAKTCDFAPREPVSCGSVDSTTWEPRQDRVFDHLHAGAPTLRAQEKNQ